MSNMSSLTPADRDEERRRLAKKIAVAIRDSEAALKETPPRVIPHEHIVDEVMRTQSGKGH